MNGPCLVCGRKLPRHPLGSHGGMLCRACCTSYDKGAFKIDGVLGAIAWAAKRAARFERLRLEKRAKEDERERSL